MDVTTGTARRDNITALRKNDVRRVAFIGNALPRRCGIATFTTDLRQAVAAAGKGLDTCIVAMNDRGRSHDYADAVAFEIDDREVGDYIAAAKFLNSGKFDAVSLQHEFGIFGGEAGSHILSLARRLEMPLITTLHTVLEKPSPAQREVMAGLADTSARLVVMAEKGREILLNVYNISPERIAVIPHGIPDFEFLDPEPVKARLGYQGHKIILTFGLLAPSKGIEVMIDAMPEILRREPDALYIVLGATHPNLLRNDGEAYRDSLVARVEKLGIADRVVLLNRFVDQPALLEYIAMCDVYATPYLNEAQLTSGTLAYSFGLGKAVVSTPYWHANELLSEGRGILVPFGDAPAMAKAIADLLTDRERRLAMRLRAYKDSRAMTWERIAELYLDVFRTARPRNHLTVIGSTAQPVRDTGPLPEINLAHFNAMCDGTGLLQHSVYNVPDRAHGYCIDDNARALLVSCALSAVSETPLAETQTGRFAAFIQHAWNADVRRFRNFMSFDRRWLEEAGSEDSHGRTLWALGEYARSALSPSRKLWAAALFAEALPPTEHFTSPRAWAFTLLGLEGYCAAVVGAPETARLRELLAKRIETLLHEAERPGWTWFEKGLSYDNARLPQALIVTGMAMNTPSLVKAGLRTLRWLMKKQTAPQGHFRAVGSKNFGNHYTAADGFDQQPIEAAATISACLAAWRADGNGEWRSGAARAFAWFLGANDLGVPLVDAATGSCRDGLHPARVNENCGGESVVSYILGLAEMRQLARSKLKPLLPSPQKILKASGS
ncbi:MAG: glycosyltransferase family 4 protein [Aestuariivirga sp.]